MIITTTLINLRTLSPLIIIPIMFRINEARTMKASKRAKPSYKYIPLEANDLRKISIMNIIKNT